MNTIKNIDLVKFKKECKKHSASELAKLYGVHRDTMYRWRKKVGMQNIHLDEWKNHMKTCNVWKYGTEEQKECARKKISEKAKKRFAEGRGNLKHDGDWKRKMKKSFEKKRKEGYIFKGRKKTKEEIEKIRKTVLKKIKTGEIPKIEEVRKKMSSLEKKKLYRVVSCKRKEFLDKHPSHMVVARIYRNGGKGLPRSEPQQNIFNWAKNKFNERIKIDFPFEFKGRYAFGDVVFLDRKLVIEYDGWAKTDSKIENRDLVISKNGFSVERFRVVCFEEIEDVINSYPIVSSGVSSVP